ncbi:MAG TPA: enolase C-terminal domain-like protein [Pseudolabrys sp.]|nr:enolase C-terminal domain-like protein [Pseudolabrys sp.]
MRIKTIEPIAISLPMVKPVIMAGEEVRVADNMLVRIESDTGVVGWGEAASAPTMTGETVASMMAAVHYMMPALTGRDPDDLDGAHGAMDGRMYGNHAAKAAIEIALLDLVGKAIGKPVHALLGEKKRSRIPLLGVIGGGDLDGDLRDAAKKKTAGYTIFKIKVGVDTPAADARRTREVCNVLGSGNVISADANQGFDTDGAIAFVRAVDGAGLDFFEQPVVADDLAGMAKVAAASGIAIAADEGIHAIGDIQRHHDQKAARGVGLKAIKLGGIRAMVEAGRLCDRLGMSVNISCKTGESSVACAAALHVASVIPGVAWGLTLTNLSLAQDVTANPLQMDRGFANALDLPGLGIDVDEDRVRHHRGGATLQVA